MSPQAEIPPSHISPSLEGWSGARQSVLGLWLQMRIWLGHLLIKKYGQKEAEGGDGSPKWISSSWKSLKKHMLCKSLSQPAWSGGMKDDGGCLLPQETGWLMQLVNFGGCRDSPAFLVLMTLKHRFTASNAQLQEHKPQQESRNLPATAAWAWVSVEEFFLEKKNRKMEKVWVFCLNREEITLHFDIFIISQN